MRLSLNKKLLVGLICGTLLMGLVLWLAHQSVQQVRATSDWTDHTQEVRLGLVGVGELLASIESGQRGYLLTGQERYFVSEDLGFARLRARLDQLADLIADNSQQVKDLARVRAQLEKRFEQLQRGAQARRQEGLEAARIFVGTDEGRRTTEQIRALLSEMSRQELSLLESRKAEESASLVRNFVWSAALSGITIALLLLAYALVRRENVARTRAVLQLDEVNASLEARVAESVKELSVANAALKQEIEQRAAADSALQRSHELLETRVRERTAELSEANASKSRFLSAASHDLRQPLHSLSLLNASLRSQPLGALATEIVAAQRQSLESMSKLVNSLLNISMLEAGVIHPQITDFPLSELIEPLRAEFLPIAQARGLQLQVDVAANSVHCDATLLRQIVQNLLGNALRYTQRGQVRLLALEQGSQIRLEVSDTGPGIAADQLERIFEEFHQLRTLSGEKREGFGLGLAIVRHLAKLLGIELEVNSAVGVGTTFSLLVPAGRVAAAAPCQAGAAQALNQRPGRVLLIDDEEPVRKATALFLRLDGHEVITAGSPEEALRQLDRLELRPEVIITDYQLGATLTGADLIEQIRTVMGRIVPAIVLSGDMLRVKTRCARLADCRAFHKPVDAEELARYLRSVLDRALLAS